jgi:hypothetical protein
LVSFELRHPISQIGLRGVRDLAVMGVPKTPVNENHLVACTEYEIGLPR